METWCIENGSNCTIGGRHGVSSLQPLGLWPKRATVAHACVVVRASMPRRVSRTTFFEIGCSRTVSSVEVCWYCAIAHVSVDICTWYLVRYP